MSATIDAYNLAAAGLEVGVSPGAAGKVALIQETINTADGYVYP